jgi:hypothetical protein
MGAWRRIALVGLALGCGSQNGFAQAIDARGPMTSGKRSERLPVVVTASVGPDGRVVPGSGSAGGPVQRIGQELSDRARVGADSPCAEAPAMTADEARRLVDSTAREEQFEPALVMAIAKVESEFVSTSVSPKGAYGLMQLMPATAQVFGVNICDPKDNVRGGIAFLRELTAKYRNPVYVLAAYNAGEPAILKAKGLPPIGETVGYVAAVLNNFYEWPANPGRTEGLGSGPGRPQRSMSAEAGPSRPARRGTRDEANGWQGGFVQNFD